MSREVVVLDPAAEDLDDAVRWYDARRPGWGTRLLLEVHAVLELVGDGFDGSADPTAHDPDVRRVLLRRFPFAVVFVADARRVEIVALAHLRRMPGYWRGRWVADPVSRNLEKEVPLEFGPHGLGRDGSGVFMGGYFSSAAEFGHGCRYVTATHSPSYHDYSIGFRCCADAAAVAVEPKH